MNITDHSPYHSLLHISPTSLLLFLNRTLLDVNSRCLRLIHRTLPYMRRHLYITGNRSRSFFHYFCLIWRLVILIHILGGSNILDEEGEGLMIHLIILLPFCFPYRFHGIFVASLRFVILLHGSATGLTCVYFKGRMRFFSLFLQ